MKSKIRKAAWIFIAVLILAVAGFVLYASDYYHAQDKALEIAEQSDVKKEKNITVLVSGDNSGENDTGIVFYPGAKVQPEAYLPLADSLRDRGYSVYIVHMPFNMAIFSKNAADDVIAGYDDIENWYIMGHSMGGAMASSYAADNSEKIRGLILLGAYIYGDYPVEKTLTVYGSYNTSVAEKTDYSENVVIIEGGNHAKFGNYGKQKGDPEGDITAQEQQRQTVEAICEFTEE